LPSAAGDIAGFPARITALGDAFAHVYAFCLQHEIPADDALRLKLVVEELFTNTVKHGYRVESDAAIRIQLEATPGAVELVYEDEAPPFDPTSRFDSGATLVATVDANRPVGGLGLRLLGQFVQDARYERRDGCNRLWLRLAQAGQRGAVA
jgi:anti-sigma regulatory factor (Ser/Thr protein kinase)